MKKTKVSQQDIQKLVDIRTILIKEHGRYRDYKSNKNAIMKESDHVVVLEKTIKHLDVFLKEYVEFK
jgi:hypothetical protein